MSRIGAWIVARWERARRRHRWLDNAVRAAVRYDRANGGLLAAGVTFHSFFAVFALALLAFSVLGQAFGNDARVVQAVSGYLTANLPKLDVNALRQATGAAGWIGLIGFVITGLGWVDALRAALRLIWCLNPWPGSFLVRRAVDLLVLAGMGVLLAASIGIQVIVTIGVQWAVEDATGGRWVRAVVGFLLGLGVNTVLGAALLTAVPRVKVRRRRLLWSALLIAVGLEALKLVGQFYIVRTTANPAYQVVASAVGLLIFLFLLNQLVLYAGALTATGTGAGPIDTEPTAPGADLTDTEPAEACAEPAGPGAGPADAQPAEAQPADTEPADTEPADTEPAEPAGSAAG